MNWWARFFLLKSRNHLFLPIFPSYLTFLSSFLSYFWYYLFYLLRYLSYYILLYLIYPAIHLILHNIYLSYLSCYLYILINDRGYIFVYLVSDVWYIQFLHVQYNITSICILLSIQAKNLFYPACYLSNLCCYLSYTS